MAQGRQGLLMSWKRGGEEMFKKIIFITKQIAPCLYWSKYKDANGKQEVCIWRQWFGKVLWTEKFLVVKP
jgi:hypothetical protein